MLDPNIASDLDPGVISSSLPLDYPRRAPEHGRGLWVAFEGIDGSGKSTQASQLADRFSAVLLREPGGSVSADRIRSLLLGAEEPPLPITQALLFAAARAETVPLVSSILASGTTVFSDRSVFSSLAYQGAAGVDTGFLLELNDHALDRRWPDLVVYLRLDPEVAVARLVARSRPDALERGFAQLFAAVAARFDDLAVELGWITVDATSPPAVLTEEIAAQLTQAFASSALSDRARRPVLRSLGDALPVPPVPTRCDP